MSSELKIELFALEKDKKKMLLAPFSSIKRARARQLGFSTVLLKQFKGVFHLWVSLGFGLNLHFLVGMRGRDC